MIVPHGIRSKTGDILAQRAIQDRRRNWTRDEIVVDPWESPGGGIVPQILDGRIVIEIQAVDKFFATQLLRVRITHVSVVEAEMIVLGVVSDLEKAPYFACPSTREEQRDILRKLKAAILCSWYRRLG